MRSGITIQQDRAERTVCTPTEAFALFHPRLRLLSTVKLPYHVIEDESLELQSTSSQPVLSNNYGSVYQQLCKS